MFGVGGLEISILQFNGRLHIIVLVTFMLACSDMTTVSATYRLLVAENHWNHTTNLVLVQ